MAEGKTRLGEILVENGEITSEQLQKALEAQKQSGGLIGMVLVNLGYIDKNKLFRYLEMQTQQFINKAKQEVG